MQVETLKRAVALAFMLNGVAYASWASRLPAIKDSLDMTPASLGALLLALSTGTVVALPLTGAAITRWGTAATLTVGAGALSLGLLGMAASLPAASWSVAAAGMFLYGVGTSTWDVAMNVEAAAVERCLNRSVMSKLHGGFSLGTIIGAALGATAAAMDVPVEIQLLFTLALVVLLVPICVTRFRLVRPSARPASGAPRTVDAWRERRTLMIGLLVLAFALSEGIANDWIALTVVDAYDQPEAVGAAAFACFVTAMTAGRFLGGSVADKFGTIFVLRSTAILVGIGAVVIAVGQHPAVAMAGAAAWGLGASLGFPLGITAVGGDEERAAARVSVVSSIGYAAFLGGPPLLGFLAEHTGLRAALLVAVAAAAAGVGLAAYARGERRAASEPKPPSAYPRPEGTEGPNVARQDPELARQTRGSSRRDR